MVLEENKSFLLNENIVLKNEAKVLHQKRSSDEEQRNKAEEGKEGGNDNTTISRELKSLQKELQRFKKFTFDKLDELTGRGGSSSSSSLSSSSSDEGELSASQKESEGLQKHQPSPAKKTTSPKSRGKKNGKQKKSRVSSATLRYEGNTPQTAELSPDESGHTIPLIPGEESYSQVVRGSTKSPQSSDYDEEEKARRIEGIRKRREARESKTLIFSSSITRDITRQHRSFNEKCKNSDVTIHEFKGKKATDIVKYMIPHLEEEQPSSVMFVAGGNDLSNQDMPIDEIEKVANCLVEGGLVCRNEHGVNNVYISSIMPREHSNFQGNRHRLNNLLRDMCKEFNFTFIENKNIVLRDHGHHDGVHLNVEGSDMLRGNLLDVLNC